jgi:hypothetical protein
MKFKKKIIKREVFHILKLFICNPNKSESILNLLCANKINLINILNNIVEKDEKDEKEFCINILKNL